MTSETRSIRERLRASLSRTREKLGLGSSSSLAAGERPDWDVLEESLVLADVGIAATTELIERLQAQGDASTATIREELVSIVRDAGSSSPRAEGKPRVIMIAGVNGVGKTTTVGKLARHFARDGKSVVVVAADTFRAAAQEQLATWAERVGATLVAGEPGRDPASVVHDGLSSPEARRSDIVLIDTAGRLHTKRPLMDELRKVERIAGRVVENAPHESLLVMDATVGSNGLAQAKEFRAALSLTGLVLTKMDGTARGGIVVAVARELGLPVRFVGLGEGMDDLVPFDAESFVDALLG